MPTDHHASVVPSTLRRLPTSAVVASLVLTITVALTGLVYWLAQAWPVPVAEGADARLQCMSYAPFRKPGETPFEASTHVPVERLREDLSILAPRTSCVRTYSVMQGLDAVPAVAAELGMQTYVGAWLGRDRDENEREVSKAIEVANRHPDTVRAVIVGNEVLLRGELPAEEIARQLDRVRASIRQPVTYADVWEFWERHPELATHVSFATIHILPYWEDEPVSIGAAIHHVVDIADEMRAKLGGRDVLIGETGWPSAGRSRRDAVPGRVNQTRFFREFTQAAARHHLAYNFIEAFDQPWKRDLEGAMGGAWGLFDSQGRSRFPATGAVREDPRYMRGFLSMLAGAGVALALVWWRQRRAGGTSPGTMSARVCAMAFGSSIGAAMAAQAIHLAVWNRYPHEWLTTGLYTLLALGGAALAVVMCTGRIASRTPRGSDTLASRNGGSDAPSWDAQSIAVPAFMELRQWRARPAGIDRTDDDLREMRAAEMWLSWLSGLRFLWLVGAAAVVVLHVFDARYRGFPIALFAMPLATMAWLTACNYRFDRIGREEWVLAFVIVAGSVLRIIIEGWLNAESIAFFVLLIALAVVSVGGRLRVPAASSSAKVSSGGTSSPHEASPVP